MQLADRGPSARDRARRTAVSLTPLIDVVFILLVFFMLASTFTTEQVIDMLTPTTARSARDSRAGAVLVRVRSNGSLDLNGEPLTRTELAQRVAAWSVSDRPRRYLIQPESGVTTQQVVTLVDLLKSSGAGNVSFTSP
ncbi:MAG: biopolymer transporter ExbD [Arenicellales bacterium]